MRLEWLNNATQVSGILQDPGTPEWPDAITEDPTGGMPPYLRNWLAQSRLLYGVPFTYLVPDSKLLPNESIRFFFLDRNWTDRLVDGALAVGKTGTREQAHHQALNPRIGAELDKRERTVRLRLRGNPEPPDGPNGEVATITGFLLRSAAVAGWPGIEVTATRTDVTVDKLRMDRLSPSVLLVLFDGVPDCVIIQEPFEGVRHGVDPSATSISGFSVKLRDFDGNQIGDESLKVPVRADAPRVLHIADLKKVAEDRLKADDIKVLPTEEGESELNSATLAIQLLQLPFRQRFKAEGTGALAKELIPVHEQSAIHVAAAAREFKVSELTDLIDNDGEIS